VLVVLNFYLHLNIINSKKVAMKELIKIGRSAKTGNPVVNARDLHRFLDAKQDFSNWLKGRIKKYGFIENVDYARIFFDMEGKKIPLAKNGESDTQRLERVYRIEYALTLNCAKELAMVQNNDKGREIRQYFIQKEKELWALKEELARKPEALYSMTEIANLLGLRDYYGKIGRNSLYNILFFHKIVDAKNRPVEKYVKKGYFTKYPTRVTEDGLKWLNQRFSVETSGEATGLKELIEDLKKKQAIQEEKQNLMLNGVKCVVETLYFNKGGKKTEEQNRMAIEHLHGFLEMVGRLPKALN